MTGIIYPQYVRPYTDDRIEQNGEGLAYYSVRTVAAIIII